jgi:hypothetical protein
LISGFPNKIVYAFLLYHACYMPFPWHVYPFHHPSDIWKLLYRFQCLTLLWISTNSWWTSSSFVDIGWVRHWFALNQSHYTPRRRLGAEKV